MKAIRFLLLGIFFGIVMTMSEAVSWYRIQEMFRFQSFHMYGIIGSALIVGLLIVQLIKLKKLKSVEGDSIQIANKEKGLWRYLIGGSLFGLGWALSGACPGPMFVLVGNGLITFGVVILSAVFGTFLYGMTQKYLPH